MIKVRQGVPDIIIRWADSTNCTFKCISGGIHVRRYHPSFSSIAFEISFSSTKEFAEATAGRIKESCEVLINYGYGTKVRFYTNCIYNEQEQVQDEEWRKDSLQKWRHVFTSITEGKE